MTLTTRADAVPDPGRVAVVTGAKGTLGEAIVREIRRGGAFATVHAPGRRELDVVDAESVSAFFGTIERVDLLVNNAGLIRDATMAKMTEVEWDAVLDADLKGAFLCSRAALRVMIRQRRGHIVHIGSYSALRPPVGQAAYAAAKAGMIGLTQSLAEEVGRKGLRVNCILPGFLEGTGMTRSLPGPVVARALEAHVLGRFNTPAEVARFIAFLDTMEAVSGQVFQLDSRIRRW